MISKGAQENLFQVLKNMVTQEEHLYAMAEHADNEQKKIGFMEKKESLRQMRKMVADIMIGIEGDIPREIKVALAEYGCMFKHQPAIVKGCEEANEKLHKDKRDKEALRMLEIGRRCETMFWDILDEIHKIVQKGGKKEIKNER